MSPDYLVDLYLIEARQSYTVLCRKLDQVRDSSYLLAILPVLSRVEVTETTGLPAVMGQRRRVGGGELEEENDIQLWSLKADFDSGQAQACCHYKTTESDLWTN